MTAEQFVEQEYGDSYFNPEPKDVFYLMTEYAKLMCDKQRQICADNAECTDNFFEVDMWSIINSPYPEELQ